MVDAPKQILVVDNEPEALMLLERAFKRQGFLVQSTRTAEQAFQKLTQKPFHALVTDIDLPGMNGIKLIAHVRKSAQNPGMPVFATSGKAASSELNPLAALKVMDIVPKPFQVDDLVVRVKAAIIESEKKKVFSAQALFETFFQSIQETLSEILGEHVSYGVAISSPRSERTCEVSASIPFIGKGFSGFFAIAMETILVDKLEDNVLGTASSGNFATPSVIGDLAQDIANRTLGVIKTRLERFNTPLTTLPASVSVGVQHTVIYRTESPIVAAPLLIGDRVIGVARVSIQTKQNQTHSSL